MPMLDLHYGIALHLLLSVGQTVLIYMSQDLNENYFSNPKGTRY